MENFVAKILTYHLSDRLWMSRLPHQYDSMQTYSFDTYLSNTPNPPETRSYSDTISYRILEQHNLQQSAEKKREKEKTNIWGKTNFQSNVLQVTGNQYMNSMYRYTGNHYEKNRVHLCDKTKSVEINRNAILSGKFFNMANQCVAWFLVDFIYFF